MKTGPKKTAEQWMAEMQPFRQDDGALSLAEEGGLYVGSDVRATLTVQSAESAQIGVALNDDLTGSEAGFAEGIQFIDFESTGEKSIIVTAQRFVTLAPGDNIRPKFRIGNTEADTPIERLTLAAWPIS